MLDRFNACVEQFFRIGGAHKGFAKSKGNNRQFWETLAAVRSHGY